MHADFGGEKIAVLQKRALLSLFFFDSMKAVWGKYAQ
jgi:hypothetical protein